VLGTLTLSPADDEVAGLVLQLGLCERPASAVRHELPADVRNAVLPYERIVPLAGA
jgi:hypothetical protein